MPLATTQPTYRLSRWLYFRLFGFTAFIATLSWWQQMPGLVGSRGIVRLADHLTELSNAGYSLSQLPSLFWLSSTDAMLHLVCGLSVFSAALVMLGLVERWALAVLWVTWLSLVVMCHPFLAFQWDVLLIEATFFSFFFASGQWRSRVSNAPEPNRVALFLMAWLSCKLTLASGIVKLASGDPSWRDLTALTFHWWTQPLPVWTSVFANELPVPVQQVLCALMFIAELLCPLLALGPRTLRRISGLASIGLQLGLMALGNYSFYNLLTLVLAIPLLDDALLLRFMPARFAGSLSNAEPPSWRLWQLPFAALAVLLGITTFVARFTPNESIHSINRWFDRFETINAYGAFAVMTKARPEIILEGSSDGVNWQTYEFNYKPGALKRRPEVIAPWQPRLDWQMWFAALGQCQQNPWLLLLQQRLLEDSAPVKALFATVPSERPAFMRTIMFDYRFAPLRERGVWWQRSNPRLYCPPLSLDASGQLRRAELPEQ